MVEERARRWSLVVVGRSLTLEEELGTQKRLVEEGEQNKLKRLVAGEEPNTPKRPGEVEEQSRLKRLVAEEQSIQSSPEEVAVGCCCTVVGEGAPRLGSSVAGGRKSSWGSLVVVGTSKSAYKEEECLVKC